MRMYDNAVMMYAYVMTFIKMYECRCCGISKHIHLEEDRSVMLETSDAHLGIELLKTLTGEKKRCF